MEWAQIGPLVGVILGVVLTGTLDLLNQRRRDKREDQTRFIEAWLKASADFTVIAERVKEGVGRAFADAKESGPDARLGRIDDAVNALNEIDRVIFYVQVLCPLDVAQAAQSALGQLRRYVDAVVRREDSAAEGAEQRFDVRLSEFAVVVRRAVTQP